MRCRIVALLGLLALPAFAADLTGKWKGQITDPNQEVVFQLKSEGNKITGSMAGADGQARPITKGELKGDDLSLTVASEWEGQPITLLVKGKMSGTDLKVTISTESGEWSSDALLKKSE